MALVKHLLERKGKTVWSIPSTTTIAEALKLLEKYDIGAMPVIDGEHLVGILSERDLVRKISRAGKVDLNAPIHDIMITNVYFVESNNSVEECMKLMTTKHIRHLPVVEKDKVVGVISIGDLVKEIIADRESTIKSLENYITGQHIVN
jgi:CBS domain-containing protein